MIKTVVVAEKQKQRGLFVKILDRRRERQKEEEKIIQHITNTSHSCLTRFIIYTEYELLILQKTKQKLDQ